MKENSKEVEKGQREVLEKWVNVKVTRRMKEEIQRQAARENEAISVVVRRLLLAGLGTVGGDWRVMGQGGGV